MDQPISPEPPKPEGTYPGGPIPGQKKKGHGCFFYGCLTFSIILFLTVGFAVFGLYYGYRNVKEKLLSAADDKPLMLTTPEVPKEELENLELRLKRFESDSATGLPTPPLALTAADINALIQNDPRLYQAKDHVKIDLSADQIHAAVSVPLDFAGQPGKYFNGNATVRLAQGPKGPELYLEHIEVHGQTLEPPMMEQLRSIDLLQQARLNSRNQEFFKLMERVQIEDGKLIIFARSSTSL